MRILHNDTQALPDLNVLTVDKLTSLFGGLDVIAAIKNFRGPRNVTFSVDEIDPVMRQSRHPSRRERSALSHRQMPSGIGDSSIVKQAG